MNIKAGEEVLVKSEERNRGKWKLAVVDEKTGMALCGLCCSDPESHLSKDPFNTCIPWNWLVMCRLKERPYP